MSLDGRINVDCLFHDRSGSERLKIASLRSGTRYTSGEVVIVTGTADWTGGSIEFGGYRNASGSLVELNAPLRLAFVWSGSDRRELNDIGDQTFRLISSNNAVALTQLQDTEPVLSLSSGDGTGTYTVLMWGPH